jgi:hypothetical protein
MIMKPLHDMIKNYQKKTRGKAVVWSTEGSSAFLRIIAEIQKGLSEQAGQYRTLKKCSRDSEYTTQILLVLWI